MQKEYLARYLDAVSEFLIPDLGRLALDYLPVKEVPVGEWKIDHKKIKKFSIPQRIVVSADGKEIYILSTVTSWNIAIENTSLIQVFNHDSHKITPVRQWETTGAKSIILSRDGNYVFVANDTRIIIFSSTGTLLQQREVVKIEENHIGCQITDIAIGDDGLLYLCDYNNQRVQVLSLNPNKRNKRLPPILNGNGRSPPFRIKFVRSWKLATSIPSALVLFREEVFIPDYLKGKIYVYSPLGILKRTIKLLKLLPSEHDDHQMDSMTISEEGEIYVSSKTRCEVIVFNLEGKYLRRIEIANKLDHDLSSYHNSSLRVAISLRKKTYILADIDRCVRVYRKEYD
jgi:hypothetical protein